MDIEFTPQFMKGWELDEEGQLMWDGSLLWVVCHRDQWLGCHQSWKTGESCERGQRIKADATVKAEGHFPGLFC